MNQADIIDDYLLGRLDEEQIKMVRERISTDLEFAKEVEDYRKIIALIQVNEDNRLRRKFAEMEETYKTTKEVKRVLIVRVLSVAAAVALIFISYFSFFNTENLESNQEIASNLSYVSEYFEPPINYYIQRSRGRSVKNKISDAMLLYDSGQYKKAAIIFDDLVVSEPENVNVLFFGGVSYLMSNQPQKALNCFMKTESKENNFSQELQWYKSLIYLDIGEKEKALKILNEIINSETKYQKNAQKIIKTIN